ncbi:MAG: hypothetical protein AAFR40_16015 [Pseudomonadota bacterium]
MIMLAQKSRLSGILSANASATFLVLALIGGSITCGLKAKEQTVAQVDLVVHQQTS